MKITTVKDLKEFIKDFSDDTRIFFSPDDYGAGNYDNEFRTVQEHFDKKYIAEFSKKFLESFLKEWSAKKDDIIISLYW